ncbi:helix-turn-helix domain-containing protein [Paenibacillus sp. YPG26]|uniref:PucR family transcriptional regulator n=1 Tax=Paenibacillus sp. YPG26 TaxID=2878915 RepID=UPI00204141FC|nr:helix-turn-helix domain-containing protein [Paenibacillus sp. YPG26]USB33436.1 helix-turn-helix domain-containing protein [Paenibacillus sp. YPG26]
MDIQVVREKLARVVGDILKEQEFPPNEWKLLRESDQATVELGPHSPVLVGSHLLFPWSYTGTKVVCLAVNAAEVSESERDLIELVIEAAQEDRDTHALSLKGDEQEQNAQLGSWLQTQLENGSLDEEIPDPIVLKSRLTGTMVPFLLSSENRSHDKISYVQLDKLLRSYFDGNVTLVPLQDKEWLILVGEALLNGFREESDEGQDAERAMLYDLCQGIYELVSNEWGGTLHLAVLEPIIPVQVLVSSLSLLRETLQLGRLFHFTEHIHLPWSLHLERLVYSIPDEQRRRFLEQTVPHTSSTVFADNETLSTLETFFQLDCNVSETAKRLYIHRNTLLYRMDKIKQETGLDVRSFRDAVLMKLTLLLYKVTKRK